MVEITSASRLAETITIDTTKPKSMVWAKEERYMWYVCLVVAMTMTLYGYDSSTFNAVQRSDNWKEYFHHPDPSVIGSASVAPYVSLAFALSSQLLSEPPA